MATNKLGSASFERIVVQRGFEQVCDQVRALLSAGHLKAGDKLPPEREFAELLGVGRGVVREALRSMEIAGMIVSKKGRSGGSFIAQNESRVFTRAFEDLMHLGSITLRDLTEARTLIMIDAIRLACERGTAKDFELLARNVDETEEHTQAGDFEKRRDAATDFYRLVALAGKNQVLVMTVEAMTGTLCKFLQHPATSPLEPLIDSRRRVLKFIQARDATKAIREMTVYLSGLHQFMLARHAERFKGTSVRPIHKPSKEPGAGKVVRQTRAKAV